MVIKNEANAKQINWIAKVGMMLIKLTDRTLIDSLEHEWEKTDDQRAYYESVVTIYREIEAVLRKCPDVKNLRWIGDLRQEHFEPFEHDNAAEEDWFLQEASAFLYFELFLPKAERQYAFEVRYQEDVIEKAYVLYNGSLFLVFAECTDKTSEAFLGQEIREFLKSRLISDRWKGVVVPPCPLHPDIMVNASADLENYNVNTNAENNITIALSESEAQSPLDFLEFFLLDNSFSIHHFLSVCTKKQKAEEVSRGIERILANLSGLYVQLLTLPWYKFPAKLGLMRRLRQIALSLQLQCNEFAKCRLSLRKAKDSFDLQTGETWNKTPFQHYFYNHINEPGLSLSEVRETVKHMADVVSQRYVQYYTVLAALVGGIVGAIITNIPFIYSILSKSLKS